MDTMEKIKALCDRDDIPISKLESSLGFSNGSLMKNNPNTMRSDRIQKIAEYFFVTPTYLLTKNMKFCVCPTCAVAYDPLDFGDIDQHHRLHNNYVKLREKMGFLLNPSQAATKRAIAKSFLKESDLSDEGKMFHYETLVQCDFAEHAYFNDFVIETSYNDFIKTELREKKYFELLNPNVIKNLTLRYDVDTTEKPDTLIDLFQKDKEFMANITDLWDLPQELRIDVYKAIRHAKRDYADKEYYTNPYANHGQDFIVYPKEMKEGILVETVRPR